jgi:hypothetical protein
VFSINHICPEESQFIAGGFIIPDIIPSHLIRENVSFQLDFIHVDFEKLSPNRALFSTLVKYVKSAFQVDFTYSSAASRRLEFSRGFQPTGWLANIPASRQRRLNFPAIWRLCEVQSSLTRR